MSSLEVVVPDYTVQVIDGYHHIEIPGGSLLLEPNMPIVPTYSVSVDYPKGIEVQNVFLLDRFNMVPQSGLNIAPLIPAWDSSAPASMDFDDISCPGSGRMNITFFHGIPLKCPAVVPRL